VDSIVRALVVYLLLLVIFRISGKRSMSEITTFDFVLVLIISESVQQAMIDGDNSIANAFLIVITLVGIDILLSHAKQRSETLKNILDSRPLVLVQGGKLQRKHMEKERVDEEDILAAARELHGLKELDQIDHAVLEQGGTISIVPKEKNGR
jgi:uncharacterized membrane protein YcaP (DUF421 family)